TSSTSFSVTSAAPSIESFSPGSGAPGSYVTFSGRNFTGTTSVKFDGVTASFSVASDTQLYASVPAGAASGPISVTNASGTVTTSSAFTLTGTTPEISGTIPGRGTIGTSVRIGGRGSTAATSDRLNAAAS